MSLICRHTLRYCNVEHSTTRSRPVLAPRAPEARDQMHHLFFFFFLLQHSLCVLPHAWRSIVIRVLLPQLDQSSSGVQSSRRDWGSTKKNLF